MCVGIFAMNDDVVIPIFTKTVLHKGVKEYSYLLSSRGIGSLIGAFVAAKHIKKEGSKKLFFGSGIFMSFFLITNGFSKIYFLSIIIVAATQFFCMIFLITANSIIQFDSIQEYRGRVMSIYFLVLLGVKPIGNILVGGFIQRMGASKCFIICGSFTMLTILTIYFIDKVRKQQVYKDILRP